MKLRKSTVVGGPQVWSLKDLGAFYASHNFELKSHANRILKDPTKADEVVQEAFVKVMLAAPELSSEAHALSYLHRTIENSCMDIFRSENRRPNLVVLDEVQAEIEAAWQNSVDHSEVLTAAEDAAIIKKALALLSPAERTALVMWEMDGRSTSEIATELGIKESSVRHTVSRARASLRKILVNLIIDEESGLTALEALSTSYKKASEIAKKSSRVALSLVLVLAAFLGFHTMTGNESKILVTPSATMGTELPIQLQQNAPVTDRPQSKKSSIKLVKSTNQTQINQLSDQLEFAKVQLSAQIDLLNVIMDTNVYGTELSVKDSVQEVALKMVSSDLQEEKK